MIVIFTEEGSMNAALEGLMSRQFPDLIQGLDWFVIDFNGKTDFGELVHRGQRSSACGVSRLPLLEYDSEVSGS